MASPWFEVGGFLVTFAVHSTLLLLLAFGLRRWLANSSHGEEIAWRVAMFGGVVTSVVQRCLGYPVFQGLDFVAAGPAAAAAVADEDVGAVPLAASAPATGAVAPSPFAAVSESGVAAMLTDWGAWLPFALAAYAVVVVYLIVGRCREAVRFRRLVADREAVQDSSVLLALVQLQRAAGLFRPVRLTTSRRLRSPVAFGVIRLEICVPNAVITEMDTAQRDCVIAHEIAHLRSGDPGWLVLYEMGICIFALQPLLRLARSRLRALAEYRCDAWVVEQTGDRVGMANTLVEVAEWMAGRSEPILAPAMAHGGSSLTSRVERILEGAAPGVPRLVWRSKLLALAILAVVSLGAPGVRLLPGAADAPGKTNATIQRQLIDLEGEIADLHTSLGQTWRLLGGRDLPEVTAALQAMQQRLRRMTQERMTLWREAMATAAPK